MTHKWKFFKDEKPPHCEEFTNFEVIHKKGYCAELTRWGDYWYCSNTTDADLVMWRPIDESGNGGKGMSEDKIDYSECMGNGHPCEKCGYWVYDPTQHVCPKPSRTHKKSKWHKVADEKPSEDVSEVMVWYDDNMGIREKHESFTWTGYFKQFPGITHWRYKPKPPKE